MLRKRSVKLCTPVAISPVGRRMQCALICALQSSCQHLPSAASWRSDRRAAQGANWMSTSNRCMLCRGGNARRQADLVGPHSLLLPTPSVSRAAVGSCKTACPACRCPALMERHLAQLVPQMAGPHQMRSAIVSAVGQMLVRSQPCVGPTSGVTHARLLAKHNMLQLLLDRLMDASAFTRARTLQVRSRSPPHAVYERPPTATGVTSVPVTGGTRGPRSCAGSVLTAECELVPAGATSVRCLTVLASAEHTDAPALDTPSVSTLASTPSTAEVVVSLVLTCAFTSSALLTPRLCGPGMEPHGRGGRRAHQPLVPRRRRRRRAAPRQGHPRP